MYECGGGFMRNFMTTAAAFRVIPRIFIKHNIVTVLKVIFLVHAKK